MTVPTTQTSHEDPATRFWCPDFEGNPLAMKAYRWMQVNREAMSYFEHFALIARRKQKKFGISLITERIRWEIYIQTPKGDKEYKICNTHRAYISRWLLFRYPQLEGFLTYKKLARERAV